MQNRPDPAQAQRGRTDPEQGAVPADDELLRQFRRPAAPAEAAGPARRARPAAGTPPAQAAAPAEPRRGGKTRTTVSVSADLAQWAADRAAEQGVSRMNVVVQAVNATADRLPEAVAAANRPQIGRPGPLAVEATGIKTGAHGPLNLTMGADNLKAIDALVEKHGAKTRSQLLDVALRLYREQQEQGGE